MISTERDVILTQEQRSALNQALFYLERGNNVVLKGSAGTGKTTLLSFIIEGWQRLRPGPVKVTAPTHKAVAVLRAKIEEDEFVAFSTVHSALTLKLERQANGDKILVRKQPEDPLRHTTLLVVDEASMVSEELLEHINSSSCPVLFSGDHKQLNPVNEDDSPVFDQSNIRVVELTEVLRQTSGNPILDVAYDHSLLDSGQDMETRDMGVYHTSSEPDIVRALAHNEDYTYLAWTNKAVDRMNSSVRQYKYDTAEEYVVGEKVMFTQRYQDYSNSFIYQIKRSVEVTQRVLFVMGLRYEIPSYILDGHITVPTSKGKTVLKKALAILSAACRKGTARWAEYDKVNESFAWLAYTYALTVHKAQGSEFTTVLLNLADLERNGNSKEKKRLIYTAITRASKKLVVYGRI